MQSAKRYIHTVAREYFASLSSHGVFSLTHLFRRTDIVTMGVGIGESTKRGPRFLRCDGVAQQEEVMQSFGVRRILYSSSHAPPRFPSPLTFLHPQLISARLSSTSRTCRALFFSRAMTAPQTVLPTPVRRSPGLAPRCRTIHFTSRVNQVAFVLLLVVGFDGRFLLALGLGVLVRALVILVEHLGGDTIEQVLGVDAQQAPG